MRRITLIIALFAIPVILSSCCKKNRFTDIQENIYNTYTENQHLTYTINDTDTVEMYVEGKDKQRLQLCGEVIDIGLKSLNPSNIDMSISFELYPNDNNITFIYKNPDTLITILFLGENYEVKPNLTINNKVYYNAYYLCSTNKRDTAFFVKNTGFVKFTIGDSLVINLINQ